MTSPVDSFADVAHRRDPDDPLIPETADPHTAIDYKTRIATELGFEDRRYSDNLSRAITERLYMILLRELPDQSSNLNEIKYEIADKVGAENPERLLEKQNWGFKRHELIKIYNELKTYTFADIREILDEFDICPVCDAPVEDRRHVGKSGQVIPPDEYKLCIHLNEDDEIIVIEHWVDK